jgi:hypothetical protein
MFIFDIDGVLADVTHLLPLIDFSNHEVTDEMYEAFLNEQGFFKEGDPSYAFELTTQTWIKKDRSDWFNAEACNEDMPVFAWNAVDDFTRNYGDEFKSRKDVDNYIIDTSTDWKKAKDRAFDEYYTRIGEAVPLEAGRALSRAFVMHKVYFVTGRSKRCMADTMAWLKQHFAMGVARNMKAMQLYMRPDGDERPAHEVKEALIKELIVDTLTPPQDMIVFEDDQRCVEMYKQLGCYVCHVKHDKARS